MKKYTQYEQRHQYNDFQKNFNDCCQNFDFYYPKNYKDYGLYNAREFFVIYDSDLLSTQLQEIFNKPTVNFYSDRGVWNSRGVKGLNKEAMVAYINSYKPGYFDPSNKSDINMRLGDPECIKYITNKYYNLLMKSTDFCGSVLAYRMRYNFVSINENSNVIRPFVTNQEYNNILRAMSKNLQGYMYAYAFVPTEVNDKNYQCVDFIVANGPYYKTSNKHITIYKSLGGKRDDINTDIAGMYYNSIMEAIHYTNSKK